MPLSTTKNESKPGTTTPSQPEKYITHPPPGRHHARATGPDETWRMRSHAQTATVPVGLYDSDAAQASPGQAQGYQRLRANVLGLLGLAAVAGGGWASVMFGDLDYIRAFVAQSSGFITYSTTGPAYTPSIYGFLSLVFMGPFGALLAGSLVLCACLGVLAMRVDRRSSGMPGKALPLGAALLLPLLVLNSTIFLVVEMAGGTWMPTSLLNNPSRMGVWVTTALACTAVFCLASDGLVMRWAWLREKRRAREALEPAAG